MRWNRAVTILSLVAASVLGVAMCQSTAGGQTSCFGLTPDIIATPGVVTLGTMGDDVIR